MKSCIVVADDDPVIINLISLRLSMADYEIVGAANGDDALKLIRSREPVMAILDVGMPGKDGIEVLRELKIDPSTSDMPVMILSGERDSVTVKSAVGAGAADYMVKPFHPDRLLERVSRLIAAARTGPTASSEAIWEL